ncbi:hypothetical protein RRF57_013060 [Xylaria bambusicola]|uniref:Uncharacterized protein n=1 Tax=Xylaria bambusicola TaxID=326684 RepID=A0AAN7UXL7_9PEZI
MPMPTPHSAMGVEYPDCSAFNLQMQTAVPAPDPFMPAGVHGIPPTPFSHQSLPMSSENMDSEFMNYMPSPHMGIANDSSHFQMDDMRRIDEMSCIWNHLVLVSA